MAGKRTYSDGCGVARALDTIGERWSLIIVRELVFGPKRFTDLRAGMPGASPNVLAQRLRELEESGVLCRRRLGPPAGAHVYELTEWGRGLEPVLLALGRWVASSALPAGPVQVHSLDALMLWQRTAFDGGAAPGLSACFELRTDSDLFAVRVERGRIEVCRGAAREPDATVEADLETLICVLRRECALAEAVDRGRLKVTGDADALDRYVRALRAPAALVPAPVRYRSAQL
jgi:DNA-binding HxlR family transcriptional regulator